MHFILGIDIQEDKASGFAYVTKILEYRVSHTQNRELEGYWHDPFGLSSSVSLGPTIALQVDFGITGISGFGFAGGLNIGSFVLQAAVDITEDPIDELIYVCIVTVQ